MEKVNITSEFISYASIDELSGEDRQLINEARQCLKNAYAPYSRFFVGAALLLENGKIVVGSNQENASYPEGLCAERVAIFAAGANYPGVKIKAIAISVVSESYLVNKPLSPCGACRQVISEYEYRYKQPIRIIMTGETGNILITNSISSLLPLQFDGDSLKKKD